MAKTANTTKADLIQDIAWCTVEIDTAEGSHGAIDTERLARTYQQRGKCIMAALKAGATAQELSAITGNGR